MPAYALETLTFTQGHAEEVRFQWANDLFAADDLVTITQPGLSDVFALGSSLSSEAELSGSAHMAGQNVNINKPIAGNLYAAGQNVTVNASVAGALSAMGQNVTVSGNVGGNLRVAAQKLRINAPISGSVLIMAQEVIIAAEIRGDAQIRSENVTFLEGGKILGKLSISENAINKEKFKANLPSQSEIEYLIDRRHAVYVEKNGLLNGAWNMLKKVAFLTALIGIFSVLLPERTARAADHLRHRPFGSVWMGALTLALMIGLMVVLALSVIGAITFPIFAVLIPLAFILGGLIATYGMGSALLYRISEFDDTRVPERLLAALIGAIVISLLTLVPFIGFWITVAIGLSGMGALIWPSLQKRLPVSA